METTKDLCGCTGEHFCAVHDPFTVIANQSEKSFEANQRIVNELSAKSVRKFETGATRDTDDGKLKYEGFISPLVAKRFSEYMHLHRKQSDGSLRAAGNWKHGMPLDVYADSLIRHVHDFWLHVEGFPSAATEPDIESVLCAIRFNVDGYLFEILKRRQPSENLYRLRRRNR